MPKMILNLNIDDDIKNAIEEKLKAKKLLIEDYILELIRNDIKTTISFNGYSYNFLYDKFYCEKEEIILTKIEKRLLRFLLNNVNNIVSIEEIQTNVWQNKNMSLFTLRNKINSIRNKTYYELIKNVSNHGYMIVIEDN